ncbi:MAG TPA: AsmA family protein [Pseudolabrys sp.]|nr:AsmA family protein [Pseudolabrys sp.]
MQTTLLGLAIAIILALVAALVGPLLIDWTSHRSIFQAQASRMVGVNVRVAGAIDARLLPSPRLILHDIVIGDGGDTIRARSLSIEFMLGPLIRGEWRASQMNVTGPQLSLGLDSSGHISAPNLAITFKPDELSVDRLNIEDGTINLTAAANGANIKLERISFRGEARSLLGPVKGEGNATIQGKPYPFRIAIGRLNEDDALKLHINVDPADRMMSIEADGTLAFVSGEPRFDGTLSLSRPVGVGSRGAAQPAEALTQPWRVNGKIKTTGQSALMENVELQYGSEEQGFKLTGVADFKFGTHPRFDGVLSGRQIDLGRVVSGNNEMRATPVATIRELIESGSALFRTTLPVQIGVGIDQITLGGNSILNLRGDITSSAGGWNLDRLEFRAPGMTQVRLSGRLDVASDRLGFTGPAEIEASDPKLLTAWLEGRSETSTGDLRSLSLRGDVTIASGKISVEDIKAEFDRKPLTGRFTYFFPSGKQAAKLDAKLEAAQFDVDAALSFGSALLAGSKLERPGEMTIAADIGRATVASIEGRDVHARVQVDGGGLRIDRLSAADFGGGSFTASGRIDMSKNTPRGAVTLDLETAKTATIAALIEKFAPRTAMPAKSLLEQVSRAKLHATLDLSGDDKAPATVAQLALSGELDDLRVNTHVRVKGDWQKPSTADLRIDATVDTPAAAPLIKLLSLDRIVAVGKGPGQLRVEATRPLGGETMLDVQLSAGGLMVQANGRGRISEDKDIKLVGNLQIADADLRPLRPVAAAMSAGALPLKLASRVAIVGGSATFDGIDAKIGGSTIHGHLAIDNASPRRIEGTLEADAVDGPALIASSIGLPLRASSASSEANWSSEPFGAGLFGKFSGKIALKLKQVALLPQLTARELNGTLHLSKDEINLDDVTGALAGGRLSGQIALRSAEDGLGTHARISVTGSDAAALFSGAGQPPVSGSFALTAEVEGGGLSPVALMGALKGSGKISLADGQFAALDPRTFDVVTRAVDQGLVIEAGRISDLVGKSLNSGPLSVRRVESALSIATGQLRLNDAVVESKDAALSLAGTLDLTDGAINARLALSGQGDATGNRPDIFVSLKGPLTAPIRSIDVSALTGWLTLRAVENQTKQLRAIENAPLQPRGRSTPRSKQAPALPAPIDVRPIPAPQSAGRPAASVGSQN